MKKRGKKLMTNKELASFLEAIKIIVQNSNDKSNIVTALTQLQEKLK